MSAAFFFFQAEDGIRDVAVTGVQTCALPIWSRDPPPLPCTAGAATCQAPSESPTHERDERHAACAPPLAQVGSGGRTDGGVLASEAVERVASDEDLASVESVPSIGGNGSDQKGE